MEGGLAKAHSGGACSNVVETGETLVPLNVYVCVCVCVQSGIDHVACYN